MKFKASWFRNGFLNIFEHGLTRGFDAITTLVVLKVLPTEQFGIFAIAQAWVNVALFLFLSPESVFYRDYGHWVNEGPQGLSSRLRVVRKFAALKLPVFILLSVALALFSGRGIDFFYALLWAFSITLGPQITGPDREFLRVDLKLKALNFSTLFQKVTLLGGTLATVWFSGGNIRNLALVAFSSLVLSVFLCWALALSALKEKFGDHPDSKLTQKSVPLPKGFLWNVLKDFTLWHHLCGNVWNWVLSADVLFLSWAGFSERSVGLYSSATKLANLSQAFPMAMQSLFSIWIGRKAAEWIKSKNFFPKYFARIWSGYAAAVIAQGAVLWFLAPYFFAYLSKQKWSAEELIHVNLIFRWILVAAALIAFGNLHQSWFLLRTSTKKFFLKVMLPWGVLGGVLTAVLCFQRGEMGAVWARFGVALLYVLGLAFYTRQQLKRP